MPAYLCMLEMYRDASGNVAASFRITDLLAYVVVYDASCVQEKGAHLYCWHIPYEEIPHWRLQSFGYLPQEGENLAQGSKNVDTTREGTSLIPDSGWCAPYH